MVNNQIENNSVEQPNENNLLNNGRSIEKQIGIVFVKTFSITLVLIFATIFYMCIFAPRLVSNISNDLGMQRVSLYFAKVQYNRDNDINSLYTVINKSIAINSYNDISKYTKILFDEPNYYDFIAFIEAENIEKVANEADSSNVISLMISFSNEDMYLKNKYVHSLIMNENFDEAVEFAFNDFNLNTENFELDSRIHWCFTFIFENSSDFEFLTTDRKNNIVTFTNMLYNKYVESETNFKNLETPEQFNFLVLCNTLKRIYYDLIVLEDKVVFETLNYDEVKNRIDIITMTIKEIFNK